MQPTMEVEPFHNVYYTILDMFAHKKIKKLIITISPQHGKLLPSDTQILTTKGWKSHGELRRGDYVFGQDGKPKMVLNNFGTYKWNVEEILFNDGNTILAAKEHLWKLKVEYENHKGRKEAILETQQIFAKKNRRAPYIDISPALEMPEISLPIDPYVLGCWLGDGHSRQGVLTVGKEDINHFSKLGETREVKPGIYRVLISGLSKLLRENGLILNKHIPMEYILASKEQRFELLRGLMDTDGCVDSRGNCEFTQKEGSLANDVYTLIRSLGIKARINNYDSTLYGRKVGIKVRINFNPDYNDPIFSLERKQNRLLNKTASDRNDKKKYFIKEIKPHGIVNGNCIEVEGAMYLAGQDLIPTHNSEGSSRKLPAFMLGLDPNQKIAIGSYESTTAQGFNKDVQRNIDSDEYRELFPNTFLNGTGKQTFSNIYARNNKMCEMVGHRGSVVAVGRSGALTSKTVDVMIMDDLYKDYEEGNSPLIREKAWKWYTSVVKTRLHNDSQELMVFTRWNEDDLVGRLEKEEVVIEAKCMADLVNIPQGAWVKINFEAIKESEPTELDPRQPGEALWESRHSKVTLNEKRSLDKTLFDCLYQGKPASKEGMLYQSFKEYFDLRIFGAVIGKGNYTDVADEGSDYLCSVCYDKIRTNKLDDKGKPFIAIAITDIVYSKEPIEKTTEEVPAMLDRTNTRYANVESNNGGKSFAIIIRPKTKASISWFYQGGNKESRIITNAGKVMEHIYFPPGWQTKWPLFYSDLSGFKRLFAANKNDDAPDVLTGIIEKEILNSKSGKGLKRKN